MSKSRSSVFYSAIINKNGFTLAETLIAVAIMSFLAIGMADFFQNMNSGQNNIKFRMDADVVQQEIRALLSSPVACYNSLAVTSGGSPRTATTGSTYTISSLKDASATPGVDRYLQNSVYGDNSVKIDSMTLDTFVPASSSYKAKMTLRLQLSTAKKSSGAQTIQRNIDVSLETDTVTNNITNCVALSEMSDGIWQKNPAQLSDIFFSGGNVGIGVAAPTNLFHVVASGAQTANHVGSVISNHSTTASNGLTKTALAIRSTGTWTGNNSTNTGLDVTVDGGSTNYAALFNGGSVGIGTTTPQGILDVSSSKLGVGRIAGTSTTLSGSGTKFLSEATVRDTIQNGHGEQRTIMAIISDSSVRINRPFNHDPMAAILGSNAGQYFIIRRVNLGEGTMKVGTEPGPTSAGTPQWYVNPSAGLFPGVTPRFAIWSMGGAGYLDYSDLIVMATATQPHRTNNLRQLGLLFKLGLEGEAGNVQETNKSGGMVLDSTDIYANAPSLHLVTGNQKQVTIDQTGRVGVGTQAPTTLLHVGRGTLALAPGAALATFQSTGGTCSLTPATSGSGISCSSDERLKEDVVKLEPEFLLEKILALQAVSYHFKKDVSDSRHTGYLAQEMKKVAPEFVRMGEDGFYQVNYDGLIPWITEAMKALYNRITKNEEAQKRALASLQEEKANKSDLIELDSQCQTAYQKLSYENAELKEENASIKSYLCQKDPDAPFCQR